MWILLAAVGCMPDPDRPPAGGDATGDPTLASVDDTGPLPGVPSPNVLLVVLDDLGVDHLALFGNPLGRTPHLDALAAEGRLFRNAWGYPVCSAARAALMTGRHASRTGYGANVPPGNEYRLDPAQTTLAELVASADPPYRSALLGKWHLEQSSTHWWGPKSQGFDYFAGTYQNAGDYFSWQKILDDGTRQPSDTYLTTDVTNEAIGQVTTLSEPWFVTVAYHAPHPPFHVPPASFAVRPIEPGEGVLSYRVHAMLEAWDLEFGRLLAAMDEAQRARTVIIVIGDNGDEFLGNRIFLRGGKLTLEDEGVHVPLVVAGPGVESPGVPTNALVSIVDVFPTVAELVGVDVSSLPSPTHPEWPVTLDGTSLGPVLRDPKATVHEAVFAERFDESGAPPHERYEDSIRIATHRLWVDSEGGEHLYRYASPAQVTNPTEVPAEQRTPADQSALERLRELLSGQRESLRYDARGG